MMRRSPPWKEKGADHTGRGPRHDHSFGVKVIVPPEAVNVPDSTIAFAVVCEVGVRLVMTYEPSLFTSRATPKAPFAPFAGSAIQFP